MSKSQLIDEIRQFNVSAEPQFLGQFTEEQLQDYLRHLQDAAARNLRISGWVRQAPRRKIAC